MDESWFLQYSSTVSSMAWDGTTMRKLRLLRRWTQAQLAAEVGVTVGTVHQWETSASTPSGRTPAAIAALFGVATLDLFGAEGGPDLRDLRRAAGLSQPEAAEIVQMSADSVHRFETGRGPLPDPYEFWADAYGVTVDDVAAAAARSWDTGK